MVSSWTRCALGLGIALGVASCAKHALPEGGLLKHFEDIDCGDDWNDESFAPEVFRSVDGNTTKLLVRHPHGCGYELAVNPSAELDGQVLRLDYDRTMDDSDGEVAACICEYRVRFDIETPPLPITKVTFDGETARLREGSSFP